MNFVLKEVKLEPSELTEEFQCFPYFVLTPIYPIVKSNYKIDCEDNITEGDGNNPFDETVHVSSDWSRHIESELDMEEVTLAQARGKNTLTKASKTVAKQTTKARKTVAKPAAKVSKTRAKAIAKAPKTQPKKATKTTNTPAKAPSTTTKTLAKPATKASKTQPTADTKYLNTRAQAAAAKANKTPLTLVSPAPQIHASPSINESVLPHTSDRMFDENQENITPANAGDLLDCMIIALTNVAKVDEIQLPLLQTVVEQLSGITNNIPQ